MLYHKNTTQTPNSLFDNHLKKLSYSELKVLLVIIRQTIGFIHPKDRARRKDRDWISQSFFIKRTGLSGRSVSSAIASLISKGLIIVTNSNGRILHQIKERRGTSRLYYSSTLVLVNSLHSSYNLIDKKEVKKTHKTKQTPTKLYSETSSQALKKMTDRERIDQILQNQYKRKKQ